MPIGFPSEDVFEFQEIDLADMEWSKMRQWQPPTVRQCCRKHWEEDTGLRAKPVGSVLINPLGMRMMLCGICGNKRCPKATDCALECTNSNKPGQPGSIYRKA